MLTPADIQNKEFKKTRMSGYHIEEVNDFLNEMHSSYQELNRENQELKDKINMLNENIQYYRTMETTIQNALVLAEKTAQDTKDIAYDKAEQIKKEAEQRAEVILDQARTEIYQLNMKLDELRQQYKSYKVQIKQILNTQLDMLDQHNINEHSNFNTNFNYNDTFDNRTSSITYEPTDEQQDFENRFPDLGKSTLSQEELTELTGS
ncbi:MAG: hypothetical protein ATN36_04160 [Epulopiscium sp. Nele67-Bin005]|nr:MAG: hypothetical protein ATN36_04160 [Epulopiscium sp. Nele67-Bin005]